MIESKNESAAPTPGGTANDPSARRKALVLPVSFLRNPCLVVDASSVVTFDSDRSASVGFARTASDRSSVAADPAAADPYPPDGAAADGMACRWPASEGLPLAPADTVEPIASAVMSPVAP